MLTVIKAYRQDSYLQSGLILFFDKDKAEMKLFFMLRDSAIGYGINFNLKKWEEREASVERETLGILGSKARMIIEQDYSLSLLIIYILSQISSVYRASLNHLVRLGMSIYHQSLKLEQAISLSSDSKPRRKLKR